MGKVKNYWYNKFIQLLYTHNQTEQQLVPVQTVRNHLNDVDGLVNPAAIVASQDGQSVFVATNNTPGSPGTGCKLGAGPDVAGSAGQ